MAKKDKNAEMVVTATEKKNLVIGVVKGYDWTKVEVWAFSLLTSGFKGVGAVIMYDEEGAKERDDEVANKFTQLGFQVIRMPLRGPIFNQRFYDIYEVLNSATDSFENVMVTDMRDVLFQSDPFATLSEKLGKKGIYAASEGIQYNHEAWGKDNLAKSFGRDGLRISEKCIYNAGVISGKIRSIADMFFNIHSLAATTGLHNADQAAYNMLLDLVGYQADVVFGKHEDGLICQCGTMADPSKMEDFRPNLLEAEPQLVDGVVTTSTGIPYHVVHQYDRNAEWDKELRRVLNTKLLALQEARQAEQKA